MKVMNGVDELQQVVGKHLGFSDWLTITQDAVNQFAEATQDWQWIHVDVERAKTGPFGRTIVHGYLTLSLLPVLVVQVRRVDNLQLGINYGANKVRFPTPVPVGARVRAGVELISVEASAHGYTVIEKVTVEIEGCDKPGCVAEVVSVLVP